MKWLFLAIAVFVLYEWWSTSTTQQDALGAPGDSSSAQTFFGKLTFARWASEAAKRNALDPYPKEPMLGLDAERNLNFYENLYDPFGTSSDFGGFGGAGYIPAFGGVVPRGQALISL